MSISYRLAVIATQNVVSSLIIRPKLRKIESAPNDLKMTLNSTRPKVPHISWITTRQSHISLRFALRSLVIKIIEVFDFSIGYNGYIWIFRKKIVKNRKLKISKIPNVVLWEPLGRIQDKFENLWLRFVGGVAFWNFNFPIGSHVNENK